MRRGKIWLVALSLVVTIALGCIGIGYAEDDKPVICMIPQIKGIDYFNACEKGAYQAAEDLPIELIYDGDTQGRIDRQIEMIETWVQMGVDAICVAPIDSAAIMPTLISAQEAGVVIVTFDVDTTEEDGRTWFVNQADPYDVGKALMDCLVKEKGEEGSYAIICEKLTDVAQEAWTSAARDWQEKTYPNMKFTEIKQAGSSQEDAYQVAKDLLKVYPDLSGFITVGAMVMPGTIEAVVDSGLKGQVAIEGAGTPNEVRAFMEDGSITYNVLWNPIDLGYAAIQVAYQAVTGDLEAGATSVVCGDVGELAIEGKEVKLGDPFIFDINNVYDFDF